MTPLLCVTAALLVGLALVAPVRTSADRARSGAAPAVVTAEIRLVPEGRTATSAPAGAIALTPDTGPSAGPSSGSSATGRRVPPSVAVPACAFGDEPAPNARLDDWASTIVDTEHALPASYAPHDLVSVSKAGIGGWGYVRSLVIPDLRALQKAAAEAGRPLAVESGYRSRSRQAEVFADWVRRSGAKDARRFSARAGHSEHQLGTAIDVRAAAGPAPWIGHFAGSATARWIETHAAEFGFVLSYAAGRETATCYGAEAWHLRYVGRERAAAVRASGLTLREWLYRNVGG